MTKNIYVSSIFLLLYVCHANVWEADGCNLNDLQPYKLKLENTKNNKKYEGKIYLPEISKIEKEFCGFWEQEKITHGKSKKYVGVNDWAIFIKLSPNMRDAGYSLRLTNKNKWIQNGILESGSITGPQPTGKFIISNE